MGGHTDRDGDRSAAVAEPRVTGAGARAMLVAGLGLLLLVALGGLAVGGGAWPVRIEPADRTVRDGEETPFPVVDAMRPPRAEDGWRDTEPPPVPERRPPAVAWSGGGGDGRLSRLVAEQVGPFRLRHLGRIGGLGEAIVDGVLMRYVSQDGRVVEHELLALVDHGRARSTFDGIVGTLEGEHSFRRHDTGPHPVGDGSAGTPGAYVVLTGVDRHGRALTVVVWWGGSLVGTALGVGHPEDPIEFYLRAPY